MPNACIDERKDIKEQKTTIRIDKKLQKKKQKKIEYV